MAYGIDVKRALIIAIVLAGLLIAPAVVLGHSAGNRAHYIINPATGNGCSSEHSHSQSHVCKVNLPPEYNSYATCGADSVVHCNNEWVNNVVDHYGSSYCQGTCGLEL